MEIKKNSIQEASKKQTVASQAFKQHCRIDKTRKTLISEPNCHSFYTKLCVLDIKPVAGVGLS